MEFNTLEALREAEQELEHGTERWDFSNWTQCTCGHIFRAVEKQAAVNKSPALMGSEGPAYAEVIKEVAVALGAGATTIEDAAIYVSDLTIIASQTHPDEPLVPGDINNRDDGTCNGVRREHGLRVVREAIAKVEAMEQAALAESAHNHEVVA